MAPEAVTHVFLSHHHPDHTINVALFPNAEVVDFWARYKDDLWLDHEGDGYRLAPHSELWLTPGHSEEDATLVVTADDGVYAMTHLWWLSDRTPDVDPLGWDQAKIVAGRERVLAVADVVDSRARRAVPGSRPGVISRIGRWSLTVEPWSTARRISAPPDACGPPEAESIVGRSRDPD